MAALDENEGSATAAEEELDNRLGFGFRGLF